MNFLDALRTVIAKYADFEGRAGRAEFWWWMLFIALGHAAFGVFTWQNIFWLLVPIGGLIVLAIYWAKPSTAVTEPQAT